jgi:7-keto-8-aminopelargonate synthetase-like enzyme
MLRDATGFRRRLIVTDTLFSMDGDFAPLARLAELAETYDSMLMVDEAHATGVFGQNGRGISEFLDVEHKIAIRVGTLSKALGTAGGFVCGSRALIDWLGNRARTYVFSTAQPAASSAAAIAALDIVQHEPHRRRELIERATDLRLRLCAIGWNTTTSESQIIPILVGDANRTMQLAAQLRDAGYFIPGIRPPSVPQGESLLRLSLCYHHAPAMIDDLIKVMAKLP